MKRYPGHMKTIFIIGFVCCLLMSNASADTSDAQRTLFQSIINNLDYVAVDYAGVVKNGEVIDHAEFSEQIEISQHAVSLMQTLPANPNKAQLIEKATALHSAVLNKMDASTITALCKETIATLSASYEVQNTPAILPSLAEGQQLYQENCVSCHDINGLGNGVMAAGLVPKPANFHDRSRQQYRNIYALYNVISLGAANTAMPSFSQLSASQRWALAFYVSSFYATSPELEQGKQLWSKQVYKRELGNIRPLTQARPVEVRATLGEDGLAVLAYLRSNPQALEYSMPSPLDKSHDYLAASLNAYKQGKRTHAALKDMTSKMSEADIKNE